MPDDGINAKSVRNTISEPAEVELAPNWSERLVAFSNYIGNVERFIQGDLADTKALLFLVFCELLLMACVKFFVKFFVKLCKGLQQKKPPQNPSLNVM